MPTDGRDEHGLKLEKVRSLFSNYVPAKTTKKYYNSCSLISKHFVYGKSHLVIIVSYQTFDIKKELSSVNRFDSVRNR